MVKFPPLRLHRHFTVILLAYSAPMVSDGSLWSGPSWFSRCISAAFISCGFMTESLHCEGAPTSLTPGATMNESGPEVKNETRHYLRRVLFSVVARSISMAERHLICLPMPGPLCSTDNPAERISRVCGPLDRCERRVVFCWRRPVRVHLPCYG